MTSTKKPPPTLLFIFGGSGDLNYRKLTPALFNLYIDGWMPDQFNIVGIGRSEFTNEKYRAHLLEGIQQFSRRKDKQDGKWTAFEKSILYLQFDVAEAAAYTKLHECIDAK